MEGQWDVRLLLLEGPTDISFFVPLFKKIYEFREAPKDLYGRIPIGKSFENSQNLLSRPICLVKNNQAVVLFYVGGKKKLSQALKLVISSLDIWEENFRPGIIGVARDMDTNQDVLEWAKSILRDFSPVREGNSLLVTTQGRRIRVIPFAVGNVMFGHPNIEEKRELELLLTKLAGSESTLTKFSRSIKALNEDKGSKLTPKDVMHVLAIAKNFGSDRLSGLYKNFVWELIQNQYDIFVDVLRESGVMDFLGQLTR